MSRPMVNRNDPNWLVMIKLAGPAAIIPPDKRGKTPCFPNRETWLDLLDRVLGEDAGSINHEEWLVEALRSRSVPVCMELTTKVSEMLSRYAMRFATPGRVYRMNFVRKCDVQERGHRLFRRRARRVATPEAQVSHQREEPEVIVLDSSSDSEHQEKDKPGPSGSKEGAKGSGTEAREENESSEDEVVDYSYRTGNLQLLVWNGPKKGQKVKARQDPEDPELEPAPPQQQQRPSVIMHTRDVLPQPQELRPPPQIGVAIPGQEPRNPYMHFWNWLHNPSWFRPPNPPPQPLQFQPPPQPYHFPPSPTNQVQNVMYQGGNQMQAYQPSPQHQPNQYQNQHSGVHPGFPNQQHPRHRQRHRHSGHPSHGYMPRFPNQHVGRQPRPRH